MNIARIAVKMIQDGCVLRVNDGLDVSGKKKKQEKKIKQTFDKCCVIHIEGVDKKENLKTVQKDIISISVVIFNMDKTCIEGEPFHKFVKTDLEIPSQILQRMNITHETFMKEAISFKQCMCDLEAYLIKNELIEKLWKDNPKVSSAPCCCGDWSLQYTLPEMCTRHQIKLPRYFMRWINIHKSFYDYFQKKVHPSLSVIEGHLEIKAPEKPLHKIYGVEQCIRITRILKVLINDGRDIKVAKNMMRREGKQIQKALKDIPKKEKPLVWISLLSGEICISKKPEKKLIQSLEKEHKCKTMGKFFQKYTY